MQRLALADGRIDDAERAVLKALFERTEARPMDSGVRAEIEAFRARYGI